LPKMQKTDLLHSILGGIMADKVEVPPVKVSFNLIGCDSNAFSVIGGWLKAAKRQGFSKTYTDAVKEAQSGNYEQLLQVFMAHSDGDDVL